MSWLQWPLVFTAAFSLAALHFRHVNRTIVTGPPELPKLVQEPWTEQVIQDAYKKVQHSPTDVQPFLYARQNRRYIVAGGSGSGAGWIAKHLLMRGEIPEAIRIIDLKTPTRDDLAHLSYIKVDVSDPASVAKAFNTPWPKSVASLPLTVFHCVAYINPTHRKAMFLEPYRRVNIDGTRNMLASAKEAGADCFVATSSASVGLRPPTYSPWPWPNDLSQVSNNAEPKDLDGPLETLPSCYTWTKAQAEKLVREANSPNFCTGVLRPGHGIYGHDVEQPSIVTWDYLRRGGAPTWTYNCIANFASNQNVSIAHLAYEHTLLTQGSSTGGKAYCVCDHGPPKTYGELYDVLSLLVYPSTPVKFPELSHAVLRLLAYVLEAYEMVQVKVSVLPPITGDLASLKPAIFNLSTLRLVYSDQKARDEIGYRSPITTLEELMLAMKDWNERAEARVKKGGEGAVEEMRDGIVHPKQPLAREVA